jgi:hypothetical protein
MTVTGSISTAIGQRGHSGGRVRAKDAETIAFWKNDPALWVSGSASSSTMPLAARVASTVSRIHRSDTAASGARRSA